MDDGKNFLDINSILPDEILLLIFNFFDVLDLLIFKQVCVKWNQLCQIILTHKKALVVDHLFYLAKRKQEFKKNHFDRLCQLILSRCGRHVQFLQLAQFRYDLSNLYSVRGLPMSPSVMRVFLQRINHQYFASPKFKTFADKPLLIPPLSTILPYLNGENLIDLCLYDIKLSETEFVALKQFSNLQKLILWPEATSWERYPKDNLLETFDCWRQLKTLKLFTLSPDLLPFLPLSITNLTIHIVKTVTTLDDKETKQLFQNNLHQFISVHPGLKKLTVLVRPRHMDYHLLLNHLTTSMAELVSFKCQYNFKRQPLNLSPLNFLRHFGIQQKFFIGYESDEDKEVVSSNITQTLRSNKNLRKITFKNCYLKNSRPLHDYVNLPKVTELHFINVFGSSNELLNSVFPVCRNVRTIVITNVNPTPELTTAISANCELLENFSWTVDDDDDYNLTKVATGVADLVKILVKDNETERRSTPFKVKVTNRQGRHVEWTEQTKCSEITQFVIS